MDGVFFSPDYSSVGSLEHHLTECRSISFGRAEKFKMAVLGLSQIISNPISAICGLRNIIKISKNMVLETKNQMELISSLYNKLF